VVVMESMGFVVEGVGEWWWESVVVGVLVWKVFVVVALLELFATSHVKHNTSRCS